MVHRVGVRGGVTSTIRQEKYWTGSYYKSKAKRKKKQAKEIRKKKKRNEMNPPSRMLRRLPREEITLK